ncbi:MAG: ABC transporter ATP-binding protein [Candidatus Riflebacteria bacterium]|nr:ABC transporter ATP-binding protein [Candidatus Riflebacteria bacterium]
MNRTNQENAVSVKALEKRFGSFVAVNKISLDVKRGEIFGFLGPNGAGKSTTIRMLCGILTPDGGSGTVGGLDVCTQSEEIKRNIGYMSQKFSLYEDLTVEENIDFYSGIYQIPAHKKRERKEWAISMAGLEKHRHTRTGFLAGGWKQRLSLGCAILHEPPALFLDEPTSGVDPISRRRFWDLISDLARNNITIFVTTHYMDEAEYCDRIALIYRGEMIALGAPRTLKTEQSGNHFFEVTCRNPMAAVEAVQDLPGVKEAAVFGTTFHLATDSPATADRVLGLLRQQGFSEAAMEKVAPTLEDVFVSLIEDYDRSHQAQIEVSQ